MGSIWAARRAGTHPATKAAATRIITADNSARGSFGFIANSSDPMNFEVPIATGTLIATFRYAARSAAFRNRQLIRVDTSLIFPLLWAPIVTDCKNLRQGWRTRGDSG